MSTFNEKVVISMKIETLKAKGKYDPYTRKKQTREISYERAKMLNITRTSRQPL